MSGGGGSGTASGTVDISGAITADYGVFEESGANTYVVTDLTYKINGSAITATRQSLGSGWYSYDLTSQVQNASTLRPSAESHQITVEVTTPAGKSAQITAQLQVRAIIQSVGYG